MISLAAEFFECMGYTVDYNTKFEGFSGLLHAFDLLVKRSEAERPVLVKDWDRTVGVDIIIKVDKASEDVDLPNPIIVAERFSDHAKAYSNKRGITLITKREILGQPGQFSRK